MTVTSLLAAQEHGCQSVQLFTKNNNQWAGKEITAEEVAVFQKTLKSTRLRHATAHDSYLINLASPDKALYRRSVDAFVVEVQRAEQLGLSYLVMHPGSPLDAGEEFGLKRIAAAENFHIAIGRRVDFLKVAVAVRRVDRNTIHVELDAA